MPGRRVIWAVTALWGALLFGASLLWPITYGYDEPQHVDMAYVYSAHPFTFYGPGGLKQTTASVAAQMREVGYPPRTRFGSEQPQPRSQRPSFAELGGRAPSSSPQPDQMVQHPPLYYWAEAVVLRLPGVSHLSFDLQIWLMRLLSIVFMLPVPLLCYLSARRLLGAREPDPASSAYVEHGALLAAVVPLTIPNLVRDGSSVTNDSLLIGASSVLLYLLARVVTGDLGRRTAIRVAAALVVAMWTKGFGLLLTVVVLAAYLVGVRRDRGTWRTRRNAIGIAAIGGLVGSAWWIRNLADYGTLQIDGYGKYQAVIRGTPDNSGTAGGFVRHYTPEFFRRIWGGIGLPEPPWLSGVLVWGWLAVVAAGCASAIALPARRAVDRGAGRAAAAVLLAATVVTGIAVTASSWSTYQRWSSSVQGAQGRYIYHTVVAVAALAAIGWLRVLPRRSTPFLVVGALVAALATQALAWFAVVRRWYQPLPGQGQFSDALHGILRWSPTPPAITVAAVFVLPALAGVAALVLVTPGIRPRRVQPAEPALTSR